LESFDIFIQAIRNQLNLKPSYYKEVSYVAGFGCFLGILIFFFGYAYALNYFGIETDVPVRQMDTLIIISVFGISIIGLTITSYFCASVTSFLYYTIKASNYSLNYNQVIDISFKCKYPMAWYK